MHASRKTLPLLLIVILAGATALWAGITGSISGIITDPSGSVMPGAMVTASNTLTGVERTIQTDSKGFYNFPDLPVGDYTILAEQKGFKEFSKTGIHIDANSAIRVDIKMEIGTVAEKVTVSSNAVHVETESTQMGDVINSEKITAVPLNGRDFTDLLALQPGVVPTAYAAQAPGINDRAVGGGNIGGPTGGPNSGNQSINGQREAANGFMLNGANVNEGKNNGTAVIPNLDSIEEFRIITNNFDAEYGNYSGGQVNVVTKSGTNQFHGDVFEFNRNTALNSRNYFADSIGKFIQNQFGGTFGGPIKRDKIFFFADYQGTRTIQGQTQTTTVPDGTIDSATGNYDLAADQQAALDSAYQGYLAGNSASGVVQGANWASILSGRLGYAVNENEPYYFAGCNSTNPNTGCVFANGVIPKAGFSPAAVGLFPYIPVPNVTNNSGFNFTTSAFDNRLRDDKGGIRMDFNTQWGMISGYYHADDANLNDAYPNGGATVPGFNAINDTRGQVAMLSDTKSFGSTAVNEFRFSYLRSANHLFSPEGGLGPSLTSLGFTPPTGSGSTFNGGIGPISSSLEGVPNVAFNNFAIGVPSDTTRQFNNTFQWQDNFTKIIGTHSIKFGGQFHYDQINDRNYYGENGSFTFAGGETGLDFADFMIGAPDSFIQASEQILDSRTKYAGLYVQDSWRVRPDLTLNYGVRWDMIQPWYDAGNKIETLIPGEQSIVFPGAPTGWVVPGDPGVPSTLAPTQYHNFSPRLGIAYSPGADSGLLAKITGGPGKMSIRAGYGIFYTSVEDLTQFQEIGDAPYGLFYVSPTAPILETPFIDRGTGNSEGQRFPFSFPPKGVSAKNPDPNFCWSTAIPGCTTSVLPIAGALAYEHNNVTPYAEDYEFSVQRQFGSDTVMSVSYVGNQGHKLITEREANPANQQLCLQLAAIGATPTCGPYGEGNAFTLPNGVDYPSATTPNLEGVPASQCGTQGPQACVVNTTYSVLGPNFGNNPFEATIAQSSYNSLQLSLHHQSKYGNFLLGYTYSKCIDDASGLQEGVNPFNPKQSLALCIFDVTHNFVGSYEVQLPFDRAFHATSGWGQKIAGGWSLSGITTFATGLPVVISENDDNSLTGTATTEAPVDLPDYTPGKILMNTNPRSGQPYFNTSLFSLEPLGSFGNSPRRFFHGPGLNNWDMTLAKVTKITESKSLELRLDAFNIWNHAQFVNPSGLINNANAFDPTTGAVTDPGTFGVVTAANPPRILQIAAKFLF
ncbi:MAG TPA: TonB-dependent receptor [Verrucomicrobiae bacterium]|nr:TonB-dependent receptor [Verrucomicrobiae bacterium]